jgi:hypothetical protein
VKRELEHVEIPGEYDARRRTWDVVRGAFAEREPVTWPQRHVRPLVVAAAAAVVVAAAVTSPGRSVVDSVRRAIGVEHARSELVRLPASGRLLLDSAQGTWVVQRDGSRRLLGPYHDPSWSPHGLFVAAVRDRRELVALEPTGNVRWVKPQRGVVRSPRWSYEGFRIAYFVGSTLHVIVGNGTGDRAIGRADPRIAPVWRPGTHVLTYVSPRGRRTRDVDTGARAKPRAAAASSVRIRRRGGRSSVIVDGRVVFSAAGGLGPAAMSPSGSWVAFTWPAANQLVFVRVHGRPKLIAVSNVSRQFGANASVAGWAVSIGR